MHRKPVRAAAIAVAALSLLALSACSASGDSSSGGKVTSIKFVAAEYSPKTAPYWDKIAKDFKAKTGITVDVQTIAWNDIHQQVSTMVQTNQLPDVLNLDSFAQYAADELLYPASEVESSSLAADIPQNHADSRRDAAKQLRQAEHPRHLGRRHRHRQHQRLFQRPDGLRNTEHRPHCQ